jgi:hypothetical protein
MINLRDQPRYVDTKERELNMTRPYRVSGPYFFIQVLAFSRTLKSNNRSRQQNR